MLYAIAMGQIMTSFKSLLWKISFSFIQYWYDRQLVWLLLWCVFHCRLTVALKKSFSRVRSSPKPVPTHLHWLMYVLLVDSTCLFLWGKVKWQFMGSHLWHVGS